ncbi:hypothetical protein CWS02_00455 [Enterobacter sp. EA-1]|nr:hypothetical protein CWS02_00455 [Enterobacter sp. EA-1]
MAVNVICSKSYLDYLLNQYDDITLVVAAGTGSDLFNQITDFSNRSGHQVFILLDADNAKLALRILPPPLWRIIRHWQTLLFFTRGDFAAWE